MRVHVIVAESDPLVCEGLAQGLREEPDLVAFPSMGSPQAALERCRDYHPCVLLLDESFLETMDVLRFAAQVDHGRAVPVLALGCDGDVARVIRCLRLGCMGYFSRQESLSALRKAIYAVAAGQMWASRAVLTLLVREVLDGRERAPQLTAREGEILGLIRNGSANAEISQCLFISPETVRWHVRRLFAKIGVCNRAGAAEFARLHQLVYREPKLPLPPAAPLPLATAQRLAG